MQAATSHHCGETRALLPFCPDPQPARRRLDQNFSVQPGDPLVGLLVAGHHLGAGKSHWFMKPALCTT